MKSSNATSARATPAPRPTGQSSARRAPTRIKAEYFALAGPSDPPDPKRNAYRKDLADVALAGRVIASHYAEPIERTISIGTPLRFGPSEDSEVIRELGAGEPFALMDDSVGWAWGYAAEDRLVGYVRSEALAIL